jgi:hypothetical protein
MQISVSKVVISFEYLLSYYGAWVLDITLNGNAQQMYLISSSPADGVLTSTEMSTVTSAWQEAVSAISGVSEATVTEVTPSQTGSPLSQPWCYGGGPVLAFDDTWFRYGYNVNNQSQTYFAAGSPAVDGTWTAADLAAIAVAIDSAFGRLSSVTTHSYSEQLSLSPASVT